MPSLGSLYYPSVPISEAADVITAIEEQFRGSISTSGLAAHLGMAENGGAFANKLTALHRYGLVTGRGTLTVTALGQRIAHPRSPAERNQAMGEGFLGIELFRRLHERLGGVPAGEGQLRILVEEITGAPRREVATRLARVRRLYEDGSQLLRIPSGEAERVSYRGPTQTAAPEAAPQGLEMRKESRITVRNGSFNWSVEMSPKGIGVLRKLLDVLEEQLRIEDPGDREGDETA